MSDTDNNNKNQLGESKNKLIDLSEHYTRSFYNLFISINGFGIYI